MKSSGPDAVDLFGQAVAFGGEWLAVGAPEEGGGQGGIGGNPEDNSKPGSGAVYLFERSGASWSGPLYVKAPVPGANDRFGWSVATDGNLLVVGAIAQGGGTVHVYRRQGAGWSYEQQILGSQTDNFDAFGFSVAIAQGRILVGAPTDEVAGPGTTQTGAVYLFDEVAGLWLESARLPSPDEEVGSYFGSSLAADGNSLVVGAPFASGSMGSQQGRAYAFELQPAGFSAGQPLFSPTAEAAGLLGWSVAIEGDWLALGAPGERNGEGSAHLFRRSAGQWQLSSSLAPPPSSDGSQFGWAVDFDGDRIVVGQPTADTSQTGSPGPNSSVDSGAARVFARGGTQWYPVALLESSQPGGGDRAGSAVAFHGGVVVVGAPFESSASSGIGGDPSDNSLAGAGAVYAYEPPCGGVVATVGEGCASSTGPTPSLSLSGCALPGAAISIDLSNGPPGAPAVLLVHGTPAALPLGFGCTLWVSPNATQLPGFGLDSLGSVSLSATIPMSLQSSSVWLQAAVLDLSAPLWFALSNGLRLSTP